MSVANNALAVYDEKARPLPQGCNPTLHLVKVICFALRVGKAREGNVVLLEVFFSFLKGVIYYGDDLSTCVYKLVIPSRQLTEMPSAKWSREASQKYYYNTALPSKIIKGDLTPLR